MYLQNTALMALFEQVTTFDPEVRALRQAARERNVGRVPAQHRAAAARRPGGRRPRREYSAHASSRCQRAGALLGWCSAATSRGSAWSPPSPGCGPGPRPRRARLRPAAALPTCFLDARALPALVGRARLSAEAQPLLP
jgi:hypothetical protein